MIRKMRFLNKAISKGVERRRKQIWKLMCGDLVFYHKRLRRRALLRPQCHHEHRTCLAATATMNELRELCKLYQPALIFLMETRAPRKRISKLQRTLRFHSSYCVESQGLSGGLCVLWTDQVNVQILQESQNYIHMALCFKQGGGF